MSLLTLASTSRFTLEIIKNEIISHHKLAQLCDTVNCFSVLQMKLIYT
jgi:hypothetical protein